MKDLYLTILVTATFLCASCGATSAPDQGQIFVRGAETISRASKPPEAESFLAFERPQTGTKPQNLPSFSRLVYYTNKYKQQKITNIRENMTSWRHTDTQLPVIFISM